MPHKHTIKPINRVNVPPAVQQMQREQCADRIMDSVERLLEGDPLYQRNHTQLRSQFTAGVINLSLFNNIRKWQIGDAVRRAGLPLAVTRGYLMLAPEPCCVMA